MAASMRVAIIGTGYVGLTTGVALAYVGHEVVGVDKDLQKLELLFRPLRVAVISTGYVGLTAGVALAPEAINFQGRYSWLSC
jgi:UDP-glucose 6-dehydrogenase